MRYKIVSDSSSNLLETSRSDYATVPLRVVTDLGECEDTPGADISSLIEQLQKKNAYTGTSCPNTEDWMRAFDGADEIYCITISSRLSGSYHTAETAARLYCEEHPGVRIHIFDSRSTGPHMQLLIAKIREAASAGKTFEEVIDQVKAYQAHTHILFSLQSIRNLQSKNRIGSAITGFTELIGLRFIGKGNPEGRIAFVGKCRGEKKNAAFLLREMKRTGYTGEAVRISHCANAEGAMLLADRIQTEFPEADIHIDVCGALCSYYAEKGGLIVGFEDRGVRSGMRDAAVSEKNGMPARWEQAAAAE